MKPHLVSGLKVHFLGAIPYFEEKSGILNSQEIVSLSAILTFRGQSIKKILRGLKAKKGVFDEKIKSILQESSLRGHASMATTPALCLTFEGSKFLDSALTGIVFSSSLMASGRRTETNDKDVIYPDRIFKKKSSRNLYAKISKTNIKTFNYFLSQGVAKDDASKILQYGIYGTGIIQLPIESIIALKREYDAGKEWMPEEVGIFLQNIEKKLKKFGLDLLYATRQASPGIFYPYPNIFKNPEESNLVRELLKEGKNLNKPRLISLETLITPELKRKLEIFWRKLQNTSLSFKKIKKDWFKIIESRQEILRDYNQSLSFKFLSSLSWRVWGEKKRHRTCPMIVESVYYSIERTARKFKKFEKQIKKGKINTKLIEEIEQVFSIPPSIRNNPKFLSQYLLSALASFDGYQKLIKMKIKPREAIFLIPRAVKIDILQECDLYNLIAGYYPLRLCATVEGELRKNTFEEVKILKRALQKKRLGWLNKLILPKCNLLGFCPERESCGQVKRLVGDYNQKFHQEMSKELDKMFKNNLKKLEK